MRAIPRPGLGAACRAQGPILLVVGALIMHWLCYLPRGNAGSSGAQEVHAYLIGLTPAAIALAVSALAASLLAPLTSPKLKPRTVDLERHAARYAAVLIAFFLAQELTEVILAGGSAGFDAMAGPASWLAPPLAFALGLIAAVLERGLVRAERRIIGVLATGPRAAVEPHAPPVATFRALATQALAFGLARRGPPLTV